MGTGATRLLPTAVIECALAFWGWCLVDFAGTVERDLRSFRRTV